MSETKKRVVIIEDHPMVHERLAELISRENDMEVAGEAEDALGGSALFSEPQPDLAIIDITLKGSSGLELIKALRGRSISTPILALSMHEESVYAHRALRAGANGYISKNSASSEVLRAARKVLAGDTYLSAEMTSCVLKRLTSARSECVPRRSIDALSDRELAVLEMIGRGRNSRAIADALKVGVATIDTYRARIKEKMNLRDAFELQHFAIRWLRDRE